MKFRRTEVQAQARARTWPLGCRRDERMRQPAGSVGLSGTRMALDIYHYQSVFMAMPGNAFIYKRAHPTGDHSSIREPAIPKSFFCKLLFPGVQNTLHLSMSILILNRFWNSGEPILK